MAVSQPNLGVCPSPGAMAALSLHGERAQRSFRQDPDQAAQKYLGYLDTAMRCGLPEPYTRADVENMRQRFAGNIEHRLDDFAEMAVASSSAGPEWARGLRVDLSKRRYAKFLCEAVRLAPDQVDVVDLWAVARYLLMTHVAREERAPGAVDPWVTYLRRLERDQAPERSSDHPRRQPESSP